MTLELPQNFAVYLQDRFRKADVLLFTGAGYSRGATNRLGSPFPLLRDLKPALWKICYGDQPYSETASVQDLFANAKARAGGELLSYLQKALMAQADGIPEFYDEILKMPWRKVYTLNVDNLGSIVAARTNIGRRVRRFSALRPLTATPGARTDGDLDVVHLNGLIEDGLDGVTFSIEQYADRLGKDDPYYMQCAADLAALPAVFIGSPLDESPLWQHMRLRSRGVERAYRKRSFLIAPELDAARAELLHRELGVEYVKMDASEFADFARSALADAIEAGVGTIRGRVSAGAGERKLPLVAEAALMSPASADDYLLGARPSFGDVRSGRTATRDIVEDLARELRTVRETESAGVCLLVGTAGSGKSTALMQLALRLDAEGLPASWYDAQVDVGPHDVARAACAEGAPSVLIVDDAGSLGTEIAIALGEQAASGRLPRVILCCRAHQADRLVDALKLSGLASTEFVLQNLSDVEIDELISVLDGQHRLGVLKGMKRAERLDRFRRVAGRQLIVAMLEATSGRPFKEILVSELDGLEGEAKSIYSMVAVASAFGFGVTVAELLIAVSGENDRTHRSVETLERRRLLVRERNDELRVRHPVIAQVLLDAIIVDGAFLSVLKGLAVAFAATVGPMGAGKSRAHRRMRAFMQHDFLFERVQANGAALIYESLQQYMSWDHHYWLQRGSFELEHGRDDRAENFLGQAISLAPNDHLCRTEFGYLRLKQAVKSPSGEASRALLEEGYGLLEAAIEGRRKLDPHQYHILGSQIIAWTKRGDVTRQERIEWLARTNVVVADGYRLHPRNEMVRTIWVEIQNEILGVK